MIPSTPDTRFQAATILACAFAFVAVVAYAAGPTEEQLLRAQIGATATLTQIEDIRQETAIAECSAAVLAADGLECPEGSMPDWRLRRGDQQGGCRGANGQTVAAVESETSAKDDQ